MADLVEKSGLEHRCRWCNEMADTTEMVLIEGIFPVHNKCKDDFVASNLEAGNLPAVPSLRFVNCNCGRSSPAGAHWETHSEIEISAGGAKKFKSHFNVDSDTGIFMTNQHILRDPEWCDVWETFKDWLFKRPRYFTEKRIGISSSEPKFSFSDEPSLCENCGRMVGAHICRKVEKP